MVLRVERARPRRNFGDEDGIGSRWKSSLRVEVARPRTVRVRPGSDQFPPLGGTENKAVNQKGKNFTIFIDNVSKRTSKSALVKAFSDYGPVSDAFIAYKSQKRRLEDSTFAFVRYENEADMKRAISGGNFRILNGCKLRVGEAKYERKPGLEAHKVNMSQRRPPKEWREAKRDERSFKTALLSSIDKINSDKVAEGDLEKEGDKGSSEDKSQGGKEGKKDEGSVEDDTEIQMPPDETPMYECNVPSEEMCWLESCMIGKLSSEFDIESVQKEMDLKNIQCMLVAWNGRRTIMRFDSREAMEKVIVDEWNSMNVWFETMEVLEPNCRKKIRVEVSLLNFPVLAWHPSFFEELGNRWGSFVSISSETMNRENLELAKLTIDVESIVDIPRKFKVMIGGEVWLVGVLVEDLWSFHGWVKELDSSSESSSESDSEDERWKASDDQTGNMHMDQEVFIDDINNNDSSFPKIKEPEKIELSEVDGKAIEGGKAIEEAEKANGKSPTVNVFESAELENSEPYIVGEVKKIVSSQNAKSSGLNEAINSSEKVLGLAQNVEVDQSGVESLNSDLMFEVELGQAEEYVSTPNEVGGLRSVKVVPIVKSDKKKNDQKNKRKKKERKSTLDSGKKVWSSGAKGGKGKRKARLLEARKEGFADFLSDMFRDELDQNEVSESEAGDDNVAAQNMEVTDKEDEGKIVATTATLLGVDFMEGPEKLSAAVNEDLECKQRGD